MRRFTRWTAYAVLAVLALLAAVAVTWAFMARQQPPLQVWHRQAPASEWGANDLTPALTRQAYFAREDRIFSELSAVEAAASNVTEVPPARFGTAAPMRPTALPTNWNRTYETTPPDIRGGALLLHGMTDGPYSMRAVAAALARSGYYSMAMRMPGHGTTPGGLEQSPLGGLDGRHARWSTLVRERIGPDKPVLLVGYSNGGALSVLYALDALDDSSLPKPDRLVLLSPMIGVSPFAGLSPLLPLLARIPYFDRAAWTSIQIEYNPFKYNSFPAMAGAQSHALTTRLASRLERLQTAGRVGELPPVLTFQSVVDATVSSAAVVDVLHARLAAAGSALVALRRQSPGDGSSTDSAVGRRAGDRPSTAPTRLPRHARDQPHRPVVGSRRARDRQRRRGRRRRARLRVAGRSVLTLARRAPVPGHRSRCTA